MLIICIALSLLCGCSSEEVNSGDWMQSWDDLSGCTVAVVTGAIFDGLLLETDGVPKDLHFIYTQSDSDSALAVMNGKADVMVADKPIAVLLCNTYPELAIYEKPIAPDNYGFLLQKNSPLTDSVNKILVRLKQDGTADAILKKWLAPENDDQVIPEPDWPGSNGTLCVGLGTSNMPMTYMRNGKPAGYETELLYNIARDLDMQVKVESASFESVLAGVASGKYDIGAACLSITEQRKEVADMTEPHYEGAAVFIYKGGSSSAADTGFLSGLISSLRRTFLEENRWQLFLSGILTTLWITIASIVLGTLLGCLTYFLCKDGNKMINKITSFCIWLVEGMPMVVLLMILYYIVFGSSELSGTWVAIIGFTLTFGCSVFGMVKNGVNAVDSGQMEAALAMGYENNHAFFRIILPQAAKYFVEPYKSAVTQHIKATSIVGYIAVQDLTKMSDIVRSRTYEAFLPLIATAVFYFILAGVLNAIVNGIQINLDSSKKESKLLKGVTRK